MIATAEERAILKAICEICSIEQIHAITELVLAERTPAPKAASAPKLCGCGFPPHVGRCQPAATPSDAVTRAINSWFDDATEDHKKRMTAALRTFARSYQVTRFRIEQSLPLHVQRHDPEYSVRVHDLTMHALLPEVPRG